MASNSESHSAGMGSMRLLSGMSFAPISPCCDMKLYHDRLSTPFIRCQLPALIEEAGIDHGARRSGSRGRVEVEDGIVGQFRSLAGVVEVVVLAEGKPAI